MRCPGCGFENETGNKFCNICGMALPSGESDSQTPLEREPLELDLSMDSLDLNEKGPVGSMDSQANGQKDDLNLNFEVDLNLDSTTPISPKQGFELDSSLEGELNLDLSPSSPENEEKGLSFDLEPSSPAESPADISLDLNVDSTELRLDVPSDDGTFDLGVGPTEIKPQVATHSPKKSPPTPPPLPPKVDMKPAPVISETPKKQPTPVSPAPSESEFDLGPLTTESQSIDLNIGEGDVGAIQVDEAAQGNQDLPQSEFSFPSMDSPDNEPAGQALDLSPQTSLETNVDNFDMSAVGSSDSMVVEFGDLDAGIPGSASQAQTQDFEVAVEQPVEPQKAIPKSSGKPAVSPSLSSKPEPVQDVVFDFSESTFPVPPAKVVKPLAPTKPLEQARKTHLPEAVEVDEDLTNLILGIEGKPKPVVTPHPPQSSREKPEISGKQQPKVELKEMEPTVGEETTEQVAEPDEGTSIDFAPPTDELQEKSVDAVPNIELEPQPEPILEIPEESVPPTPEELLAQIRTNLTESNDPDERYSLVLSLRDLRLPEVCSDFLKLLFDDLKDIREVAAEFLGEMSCKEAVRPLIQCLATGDPSLKFIAARALGSIRDETSVVPLMKLLEEDNDDLRYVALEALGKVGASGALKALSAFLKSRNHDLRYIACEAIGNVREPQSVSFLLPMLKDPDFEVRVKAIEALGKIGSTEACDQLLVVLGEDNERIRLATIHALGQIKNPNAIDSLTDIYQVSNPEIKEKIVWSLGEIGNERAVEPLLSLSQGFNSKLTLLGLEAFSKIKSAKAVRFVLSVLDRDDISLKHKAIEALGEIADKLTAGNLIPFLESPEPGLKISAAKALGKIGNAIAIDPLVSRLMDSERDVRIHAIEALGLIKGGKAIPPLINSLREQDEQIIQKTEWALCELQEMSVDPITKAIFTEPTEVVPSLVRVLGRIGSIRGIFPLLKMLEVADPKLKPVIADSLLAIDKHMTEENPISVILKEGYAWAQFSIAQALSQLNDERAFSLLIKVARDTLSDKDVKKLAGIPDKRILECSGQILHLIQLNVAKLFSMVGNDKAIPVIMGFFLEGDVPQRQWCIEALGGIQTDGALDALIDVLKKPEFQIPLDLLSKQLIASKSRKLVEKLMLSASHPAEPVRVAVAVVLGETRDPRAIRTLSGLVKDTSDKVRTSSIEAIGKIGTTAAVQPAIEALKDSMEIVRAKAAQVLGELRDTAAVEFIEKTTHDSSEMVRRLSVHALENMADARVPNILISSIADKAELVRGTAVEVLGNRKDRVAIPNLIKALEDSSESVREKAASALGMIGDTKAIIPLLERLDDPSPIVPLACSEAIVSFRSRAFPILIEALKHTEERIRRHSTDLLIRIGDQNLVSKLLKVATDRNNFLRENVSRILGRIGDGTVVDPIIKMLQDRASTVRKAAATSLGMLRDIRALVALKKAERDQSREVRQAASAALQEIFKAHKLA